MNASDTKNEQKESDPNRVLRNVVVAMGMVLIGGCILLFTLLALGVHKKDKPVKAVKAQTECSPQTITLGSEEYLDDYEIDGNVVTIYSDRDDGQYLIRRVDVCSGDVLQQLTIQEHSGG